MANKVNVTNVLALRDFIRDSKLRFDMTEGSANPECGTAGCIGGHAAVLWPDIRVDDGDGTFTWKEVAFASKLGISDDEQTELCFMWDTTYGFSDVTKPAALAVLELLAKAGKVKWRKAIEAAHRALGKAAAPAAMER